MEQQQIDSTPRFLTPRDICDMFQLTASTLNGLTRKDRFPKPLNIGGSNRWERVTIETWVAAGCPIPEGLKPMRRNGGRRPRKAVAAQ